MELRRAACTCLLRSGKSSLQHTTDLTVCYLLWHSKPSKLTCLKQKLIICLQFWTVILSGITGIVFLWVHSCCCRQLASQKENAWTHALTCLAVGAHCRQEYLESLPMDSHIMAGSLLRSSRANFQGDHKSNFSAY